jgi:hypothetical protein
VSGSAGVRGGLAGTRGGYGGASASGGATGTGGSPVDASVPFPWSYHGQALSKIDIKRCPPYDGCDVCTLTAAGSGDEAVPNLDYAFPQPICFSSLADPGTDAGSAPYICNLVAPDGGAFPPITEVVLQQKGGAGPNQTGFPNAYCQFLPGPTIAEPDPCALRSFMGEFCVSDCSACP